MPKRRRQSSSAPVRASTGSTFVRCERCGKSFHAVLFGTHRCKPLVKALTDADVDGVEAVAPPPRAPVPTVDISACTDDTKCGGPCCTKSWPIVKVEREPAAGGSKDVRAVDVLIRAVAGAPGPIGLSLRADTSGVVAILAIKVNSPAGRAEPALAAGDVILRVGDEYDERSSTVKDVH